MGVFEYLGVILSVILGLGLTHLLAGVSKIIHHRSTLKVSWIQLMWTVNVLMYIVIIWWGMFWWSGQQEWSFFLFLLLLSYAITLFLAASLLYPWEFPDDFDFDAHFFDTRPWFFSVFILAWCIDIPETVLKSDGGLRDLPQAYLWMVAAQITLGLIGALWSNRNYHKFFAVFWPISTVSYLSITTLAQIAA